MADIVCTYNRLGQISNLTDALGERNFTYNNQFPLTSESIDGIYNKEINRIYSITGIKGRYITMGIGNAPLANYSYDAVGRVSGVNNITLGYLANSNFLSTVTRPNNVNTTWSYEANRNLVTAVENNLNNSVISNYTYTNDALGRRTEMSRSGSVFSAADTLNYSYNDRSEVTGATSNAANTTYNYAYSFDNIGNRLTANLAGTPWTYTANNLNQYSAFTINQVAETPSYDDDGNMLTRDGWTQTWNGENRLIKAEKGTTKLEFAYDYMGRRIFKKVYNGETLTSHIRFVYDGYKLIEELNALNNNSVLKRYTWSEVGFDAPLSVYDAADNATYYYQIDGTKNVTELTDSTGAVVAHYEYSPFGAVVTATGTYAEDNPFRFSSEYHDDETSLVYYNYRYYSPELGRWLSKDPIAEQGGYNLYGMVNNNPPNYFDNKGKSGLMEGLVSGWGVALVEPTPFGEATMIIVTAGVGVAIGVAWIYDAITGDDAETKADERLYPNRKRKRNEGQCDCNLRPVNNCDPPESCPSFVTAWGVTRADCQRNARTLLADECKKFLGHCQFRSASVLP